MLETNFQDEFLADAEKLLKDLEPKKESDTWIDGNALFKMGKDKPPYFIEGIMPQVGISALVGSSDTGKSMILRQLAICCVRGSHFLGFKLNVRYRVALVVSTEDEAQNIAWVFQQQTKGDPTGLENLHFFFDSEDIISRLDKKLSEQKADLVVVDAWGDVYAGNQVDSGQIRQKLNEYKALGQKHDCAIVFLHHTGKRTQKLVPSKDNILAGQGFEAKMRLVMELREDIENPDYRHLCIVKGNYVGKEDKHSSFKLFFDSETFLFSDTDERVPFEDLATITDTGSFRKEPVKKPHEVDEQTHKIQVEEIFSKDENLNKTNLLIKLSRVYEKNFGTTFGGKRTPAFLDYLVSDLKLIGRSEHPSGSKNAYFFKNA